MLLEDRKAQLFPTLTPRQRARSRSALRVPPRNASKPVKKSSMLATATRVCGSSPKAGLWPHAGTGWAEKNSLRPADQVNSAARSANWAGKLRWQWHAPGRKDASPIRSMRRICAPS